MKSRILSLAPRSFLVACLISFLAACLLFAVNSDMRYVLAPVVTNILIVFIFWRALSDRREGVPLSDIGAVTVAAITCYTIIPSLQFLLSGLEHTSLSAPQLYILSPTPKEFSELAWWNVLYLFSFAVSYLMVDAATGNAAITVPKIPGTRIVRSFLVLFIILTSVMLAINKVYGINMYGVYNIELMFDSYAALLQMPLMFRQFYGIVEHNGVLFIVKLALLLIIFLNWKRNIYRYMFYAWLSLFSVKNVLWMGARTELVLTFLASAVMYHQLVRPFRMKQILPGGIILFAGFTLIGLMRGSATLGANLENFKSVVDTSEFLVSTNTEFQALFGGNYDLLQMRQNGLLGHVPLQFRLYDLVMLIPQQILPFEKLDVQNWYLQQSDNPGYFMFNPIAQSIMGFGRIELILRGLFLGIVFAKIRSWYITRATSFWATLLYFYLATVSYYTIRSTAIYTLLAYVCFRFIPLYLAVQLLSYRGRLFFGTSRVVLKPW